MSRVKGPSHELHQNLRRRREGIARGELQVHSAAHDLERRDALVSGGTLEARRNASGQEFRIARHIVHQREHLRRRCSDDGATIHDLQMGDSAAFLARQGGILAHRTVDSRHGNKTADDCPDPPIAVNRKARFDYFIEERFEAGIALLGWEVKSMRAGKAQIAEAYVYLKNGEAFLYRLPHRALEFGLDSRRHRPHPHTQAPAEPPAARSSAGRRRAPRLYAGAPAALLEGRGAPSSSSGSPRARNSTTSAPPTRIAIGSATRAAS